MLQFEIGGCVAINGKRTEPLNNKIGGRNGISKYIMCSETRASRGNVPGCCVGRVVAARVHWPPLEARPRSISRSRLRCAA